jgi:hypothetical protein
MLWADEPPARLAEALAIERVEIALSEWNLLDAAHPESFDIAPLLEAPRRVQMKRPAHSLIAICVAPTTGKFRRA